MKTTQLRRGIAGGALALMIATTSMPAPASAATNADLQAQIQNLLNQINNLKASQGASVGTCSFSFSQDLTIGRSGNEVTNLQKFLIGKGYSIPAGATGYFGGQTQAALVQFQKAQGISPAVGYFGPITRARVASLCTVSTPTPTPPKETPPNPPKTSLEGEGDFTRFALKDGDDTDLEEGDKNAEVAEVEFKVVDGDLKITRIEIAVEPDSANNEKDPWDTFSEFSIWNGSELIGKVDAGKEKNWKEDSPSADAYSIRITPLEYIVKKDKQIKFTIKATVHNNVKGTNDGELWNIFIPNDGIRALDKDKILVTTGDQADSVSINIDEAGSEDEIIIRRTDSDPDATSLQLKDDGRSGFTTVFAFDIDTDDSKNDIEIRKLPVRLTVSTSTLDTFVKDARVTIGNKTYKRYVLVDGATGIMTFEFSKGELTIDAGDRETVSVELDFKALDAAKEGTTITGQIIGSSIDARGRDTLTTSQLSGTATGEAHSLYTKGLIVTPGDITAEVTSSNGPLNDYATFKVAMQVTAFSQDVYIPTGSGGVTYQINDSLGNVVSTSSTGVIDSNAKEVGSYFFIPEGETKTILVEVTYVPGVQSATARLQLLSINFSNSAQAPDQSWTAQPSTKYRTTIKTIVD